MMAKVARIDEEIKEIVANSFLNLQPAKYAAIAITTADRKMAVIFMLRIIKGTKTIEINGSKTVFLLTSLTSIHISIFLIRFNNIFILLSVLLQIYMQSQILHDI